MTAPYHKAAQETTHVLYVGILTWQKKKIQGNAKLKING